MRTLSEYTTNDVAAFQSEADRASYAKHVDQWQAELHPNGDLECYFAAEIVRATWRIQRYAIFDPPSMSDQARTNWLRYRDQTNLGIRRNLEELRRLQSDRYLQAHLGILLPGIASLKLVLPGLKLPKQQADTPSQTGEADPVDTKRSEAILHSQIQDEERRQLAEFRKTQPAAARNAPCPCNSGRKIQALLWPLVQNRSPESGLT